MEKIITTPLLLPEEVTILGKTITLTPIQDNHYNELIGFLLDERIWEQGFNSDIKPTTYEECVNFLNERRKDGILYVVISHLHDCIIGLTGIKKIDLINEKCEIGSTLINPYFWGQGFNMEMKFNLIDHLFNTGFGRIQFEIDEINIRSQNSLNKFGATLEGTRRRSNITTEGRWRNMCVYSILKDEWETHLRSQTMVRFNFSD